MAALCGRRGMKCQDVRPLPQQAVDQVLDDRNTRVRVQALAMHDPDASQPGLRGLGEESTQQGLRLHGIAVMEVQFILRGVLPAPQSLQHLRREMIAPERKTIA